MGLGQTRVTSSPSDTWFELVRAVVGAKKYLEQRRDLMIQATCSAEVILLLVHHCRGAIAKLDQYAAVSGLVEVAKIERESQLYDVLADIATARAAYAALRDRLMLDFPKDTSPNEWLLFQQFTPDGNVTVRTFTSAQLTPHVVLLDSVIAALTP